MAGANYMGGKRNAAKSRAKNKTNRAQKRFFGQQRLNLASKRSTEEENTSLSPRTRSISDIAFAHAQKRIKVAAETDNSIHAATPTLKDRLKRINKPTVADPESPTKASKVLEAIDTSEPISVRAAMDRILTLPDLAGLSRSKCHPVRPKRRRSPSNSIPTPQKYAKVSSPLPPSSAPRTSSSPSQMLHDEVGDFSVSSLSSFHNVRNGSVEQDYSDGPSTHETGMLFLT
ncbi:hypothetical protein L218DRAFT_220400 [Marasmius fiardii PR-910]|nr:hypothetical protein L218DRAFT_220400 [Marasmius fiardii PR-910]